MVWSRNDGSTALLYAVLKDRAETTQIMLNGGANIGTRDVYVRTTMMHTTRDSRPAIAGLLVNRGAMVEAKGREGNTAPWYALEETLYNVGRSTAP